MSPEPATPTGFTPSAPAPPAHSTATALRFATAVDPASTSCNSPRRNKNRTEIREQAYFVVARAGAATLLCIALLLMDRDSRATMAQTSITVYALLAAPVLIAIALHYGIHHPAGSAAPRRLVEIDGRLHQLDIRYRMLSNRELASAMGFHETEAEYEFAGNQAEVTKQIGNAVLIPLAEALVTAVINARQEKTPP